MSLTKDRNLAIHRPLAAHQGLEVRTVAGRDLMFTPGLLGKATGCNFSDRQLNRMIQTARPAMHDGPHRVSWPGNDCGAPTVVASQLDHHDRKVVDLPSALVGRLDLGSGDSPMLHALRIGHENADTVLDGFARTLLLHHPSVRPGAGLEPERGRRQSHSANDRIVLRSPPATR